MNESTNYIKSFIDDMAREQQDDLDQIKRYENYMCQLSEKRAKRQLILNKLEELLK